MKHIEAAAKKAKIDLDTATNMILSDHEYRLSQGKGYSKVTIDFPDDLEAQLRKIATTLKVSLGAVVAAILADYVENTLD